MTKEDNEDSGFFSRWSYRKAIEAEKNLAEKQRAAEPANQTLAEPKHLPEPNDGALAVNEFESPLVEHAQSTTLEETGATESELEANHETAKAIDIESLDYNSDYQSFLKKGVPDELTNKAMRKLWNSNPILANIDGLNDYDEDYGDPALNGFKSIWKVGRGFLTDEDNRKTIVNTVSSLDTGLNTTKEDELKAEQSDSAAELPVDAPSGNALNDETPVSQVALQNNSTSKPLIEAQAELDEPVETAYKRVSLRKRLLEE